LVCASFGLGAQPYDAGATDKEIKIGISVASTLISKIRNHFFDVEKYQTEINNELNSAIQIIDEFEDRIIEEKPDLVYVFNGRITT
jgi:hypothetical protein